MKKYALISVAAILLFACGKNEYSSAVYNEKFTTDNFIEVYKKIDTDKEISAENLTYLANGLKRLSFTKDSINGKTVKDIIVSEKDFTRNYAKEQLKIISDIAVLRLNTENKFLGVVTAKDDKNNDFNNLYFTFNNNFYKGIKKLSGELIFFYRPEGSKEQVQLKPIPFNYINLIKSKSNDTLILNQPFNPNDEISNLFRNQTAKISGLMNILEVEFE